MTKQHYMRRSTVNIDISSWYKATNNTAEVRTIERSTLILQGIANTPPVTMSSEGSRIFYEPGKTHHGLPRDPYKVSINTRLCYPHLD